MHQDMRGAFLIDSKCTPSEKESKQNFETLSGKEYVFITSPRGPLIKEASVEATSYGVNFRTQLIKPELLNSF